MTTIRPIGGLLASVHSDEIAHAFSAFERDLAPGRVVPLHDYASWEFGAGDGVTALATSQRFPVLHVHFPADITGWSVTENGDVASTLTFDVQTRPIDNATAWASIVGTTHPSLSAAASNASDSADPALVGWTRRLTPGTKLRVLLTAVSGAMDVTIAFRSVKYAGSLDAS